MWLKAFTTFEDGRCSCSRPVVVARFSSSAAMRPSRSQ